MTRFVQWLVLIGILLGGLVLPAAAQAFVPPSPPVWDGLTRMSLLIMGLDRRPSEGTSLATRTDVMVLVSYDPTTKTIGMLHIPRDLHVTLPDNGELVRVNTLVLLGETIQTGYGPTYAKQAIEANFGVSIDGYLAFDFAAFVALIDALGGITVDIPYNISDSEYPSMDYGYDPFFIRAGVQTLDGETALKYARTRHGDNDYVRGDRQMLVMQSVQTRLKDPTALQNMLIQAPSLARSLQGRIVSNVPFDQLTFVGLVVLEADAPVITGGLDERTTLLYPTSKGNVRIADRAVLESLLIAIFGETYWS